MATSAAEARRTARVDLAAWGLSALDDTVSLLVTELVSNGVRHGRTALELHFSFDGSVLRIAVRDGNPHRPVPRAGQQPAPVPDPTVPRDPRARPETRSGGWGLTLVDALSTHWGSDSDEGGGKTVWFDIDTAATAR
ncbi:MAG: ATP-binding protein [Acidimicrobiales bacterium]